MTYSAAPLLDSILDEHRDALGDDFQPYRNHCQRVYVYICTLAQDERPLDEYEKDCLQVALAFHDLGIWVCNNFDYLDPSAALARDWLTERGREADVEAVEEMIVSHHKMRSMPEQVASRLSEYLRRADLIDVSLGMVRFGLARQEYRRIKAAFPICGFHGRLVQLAFGWWVRNPLRPMPMMRW